MANDRQARLRASVLEAFADVAPPRPDHDGLYTQENLNYAGKQRLDNDNSTDWTQIPGELIEASCTELTLLSAEAVHYYFPAFLIYAVDHWKKFRGLGMDINPSDDGSTQKRSRKSRRTQSSETGLFHASTNSNSF